MVRMNCRRAFLSVSLCIVCCARAFARDAPSNRSLALLQIVYRHGDRTPIWTYKNDPHPLSVWKEGPGQLTNKGCMQHYTLGGHLRKRYPDFITGDPHEIHVRSSDRDRCLASASCHLAGMYPPSGRWVWDRNFPWQPVAVHTRPVEDDPVLAPGEQYCPEQTKEDDRIKDSPEGQSFLAKYHKLYVYLTEKSGSVINDWKTSERLFNALMIEKLYNFTVPNWTEEVWSNLSYQYDQSFVFYAKTPLLQRLRAGPLLDDITKNMEAASKNETAGGYKIYMYSTHDTAVASLRQALGIFDNRAPEYCSTVLFELWEEADGSHSVEVYTLDAFHLDPEQLSVPGCGNQSCSLSAFLAVARDKVPDDWAEECGLRTLFTFSATELAFAAGLMGFLILLLFVIGLYTMCNCRMNKKETILYSPVPTDFAVN